MFVYIATENNFNSPETELLQHSKGSSLWLRTAHKHASKNVFIADELATYYQNKKDFPQSVLWYQQAIRLGSDKAVISLAQLYFVNKEYYLAQQLLRNQPMSEGSQLLLMKIAVQLGDTNYIEQNYLALKNFHYGQVLLRKLARYHIIPSLNVDSAQCDNSIQFIATNFNDLTKADTLITTFSGHKLSPYFCFNPPIYKPITALDCNISNDNTDSAIECNESIWSQNEITDTRYLIVLVPQGGANVHNGIMYLASDDGFDVFVHELTHFLGFIDEYALAKEHGACLENQKVPWSHNIATLPSFYRGEHGAVRAQVLAQIPWREHIKDTTPILTKTLQGWALGTANSYKHEVGVFKSDTCNKGDVQAFKPVSVRTKLTYNEVIFPKEYLDFMVRSPDEYRMPSYHFNVAHALRLEGKEQEANLWFDREIPNK